MFYSWNFGMSLEFCFSSDIISYKILPCRCLSKEPSKMSLSCCRFKYKKHWDSKHSFKKMALNLKRKNISQKYHKNQHKQTKIWCKYVIKRNFLSIISRRGNISRQWLQIKKQPSPLQLHLNQFRHILNSPRQSNNQKVIVWDMGIRPVFRWYWTTVDINMDLSTLWFEYFHWFKIIKSYNI